MPTANAHMSYLAELAKSSARNRWTVLSGSNYEDLGWSTDLLPQPGGDTAVPVAQLTVRGTERIKRLHRLDRLHATEGLLYLGWLWLVGETSIECHPHPDGAGAHLRRRQALARVGWTITAAFPSRWVLNADGAALHIKAVLERTRSGASG